ncbi:MAG: hypothetical protein LHV68_00415 [Elusimicrobia bacterium]|nr:hypothetical protein [Candidatus Liberimonas magnetica]
MISVIIAVIGLIASVVTASLSYYFAKQQQIKIQERRLKEEYYKSFIKALSDVAIDNKSDEALIKMSEAFNSLIVMGSPEVVEKVMDFHDFVKPSNKEINRLSQEWLQKHDQLLREMVIVMRKDLFGKEKNINNYLHNVHLVGGKLNK